MGLIDFIFPKRCVNCKKIGDYICANCFSWLSFDVIDICPECSRPAISGATHPKCIKKYSLDGTFTVLVFNKTAKKMIYQFKYRPYLADLKGTLTDLMYESLIQNEEFVRVYEESRGQMVIVPIPLFAAKLRKRGYNQAEILAKKMAQRLNLPFANALIRKKDTRSQVGLGREERRENLKGAFDINSKFQAANFKNKSVFLIDDVLTTGSTLSEAGKVLKKAGVGKVWGIALAKEK